MNEKIAVVTDSTSDLSKEILKEKNIESFPLKIIYSDREYRDRVDIQPQEVYDNFEKEIPTTSMPGPDEVKNMYLNLKEKGYTHIISIHISSGLSGTSNTCKMVSKEIEGIKIELIDSKMLSMGLGRLVLYAQELVDKGENNFESIVKMVKEKVDNIDLFFIVSTLKYLKKGGRIGKVSGTIAELLNIKPIISIDKEGEYFTFDKVRGRARSLKKMFKIIKSRLKEKKKYLVDVAHAAAEEEAEKLIDKFKNLPGVEDTFLSEISPVMVVHAGPGLLG